MKSNQLGVEDTSMRKEPTVSKPLREIYSFTLPQAQSGSYALFELIVRVVLNINMQLTLQDFNVAMDSFYHFEMKLTYFTIFNIFAIIKSWLI